MTGEEITFAHVKIVALAADLIISLIEGDGTTDVEALMVRMVDVNPYRLAGALAAIGASLLGHRDDYRDVLAEYVELLAGEV